MLESLLELTRQSPGSSDRLLEALPQTATAIWSDRFAALPATALEAMAIAAVIGTTFELSALTAAIGDETSARHSVEQARACALIEPVTPEGDLWRFTHALLREHLHGRLTVTRRRRLHRTVAATLAESGSVEPSDRSAQLAYHWSESGPSGRWPTLRHTTDAARWAFLQGAPETTRRLGVAASALIDELAGDSHETAELMDLRVQLGDALLRVGDDAGAMLMRSAAIYYEERNDVAALARIADALLRAGTSLGQRDAGTRLAERLVDRLGDVDPQLQSRVLSRLARVMEGRVGADDFIAGISETALRLARETGDAATLAVALYCAHTARPWTDDRLDRARELIELGNAKGIPNTPFSADTWRAPS